MFDFDLVSKERMQSGKSDQREKKGKEKEAIERYVEERLQNDVQTLQTLKQIKSENKLGKVSRVSCLSFLMEKTIISRNRDYWLAVEILIE